MGAWLFATTGSTERKMKGSLVDPHLMLLSQEDLWPSSTSRTLPHALCTIMNRTGRPSRIILPILVQLRLPHPLGVSKNDAPILRIAARTWQPARQQRHHGNTTMMITGLQVGDVPKCEGDLRYICPPRKTLTHHYSLVVCTSSMLRPSTDAAKKIHPFQS